MNIYYVIIQRRFLLTPFVSNQVCGEIFFLLIEYRLTQPPIFSKATADNKY